MLTWLITNHLFFQVTELSDKNLILQNLKFYTTILSYL